MTDIKNSDEAMKSAILRAPFIEYTKQLEEEYVGTMVDLGEGRAGTISHLVKNDETGGVVAVTLRINKDGVDGYIVIPITNLIKCEGSLV